MKPLFLIFGFGYTAEFLAPKLVDLGFEVVATTRHLDKIAKSPYRLIDFLDSNIESYLRRASHILVTIPPQRDGSPDPVIAQYGDWLASLRQIKWLGYLSSTGVYGNHHGEWVDESAPSVHPGRQGQLRLAAEQAWKTLASQAQIPLHIFRLAGIYGPHRNVLVRLLSGKKTSIYKEGQFFSRIHVEDIVLVLLASIQSPQSVAVYNVADDEPAAAHEVDAYAASLLHHPALPLVPFLQANLSPMEQEFYSNNRRVSNHKIKTELHVQLKYPSFREGLNHLKEEL